jgi:hypothetical protein
VRTILQDAWAIIDHQLVYKNEESTPERLRRDLNNVASLLEIAQGIFDSVKEKRAAYVSEIQQKKEDPPAFLAQPLDFDTVIAYTRWKFPDRDVSEKLTQTLLRDINLQDFSNTPRFAKRPHYFSTPSVRPDFPRVVRGSMSLERLQCSPLVFLL